MKISFSNDIHYFPPRETCFIQYTCCTAHKMATYVSYLPMDLLRHLQITSCSGIVTHGILKTPLVEFLCKNSINRVFEDPAEFVECLRTRCAKPSFPIRYGGVSLSMGSSKTPLPEFLCTESSEIPLVEFLRTLCANNLVSYKARWSIAAHGTLKKIHYRSFYARDPQKLRWWNLCAPGLQKALFPIRHRRGSLRMGFSKTPRDRSFCTRDPQKPR